MNFLAHAYLSFDVPHLIVGNFLGDFLRLPEVRELPAPVQAGVLLHRKIDSYTDQHPVVKAGTARMRPFHSKYAPVVVDMYYDYLLASNWEKLHEQSLPHFSMRIYAVLEAHIPQMPERLHDRIRRMIAADWLTSYSTPEGMRFAFDRMQYRTSRPEWLAHAFENLLDHWDLFQEDFQAFFPDLIAYSRAEIASMG
jgi:acyl carrier protein phosphodiesterase